MCVSSEGAALLLCLPVGPPGLTNSKFMGSFSLLWDWSKLFKVDFYFSNESLIMLFVGKFKPIESDADSILL